MSLIEWMKSKNDLLAQDPDRIESELISKLSGRCLNAYVFGSFATRNMHSESDIDIVIIQTTEKKFTERALEFTDLFDIFPRLDILVYTPEEFQRMCQGPDAFFSSPEKKLKQLL